LRQPFAEAAALLLTVWAAFTYDAVIYLGTSGLLPRGVDRYLFRVTKRRVVTVFCGSDARPPYLNGRWIDPDEDPGDWSAVSTLTRRIYASVRRAERLSDLIVSSMTTAHFLEGPFVDWNILGMPSAAPVPTERTAHRERRELLVVHAPSVTRWKGTSQFREALAQLREEGIEFQYREYTAVPHAEVLEGLVDADVALDELYSDALLAGFSLEAARAGAAVAVFGYAAEQFERAARVTGAPLTHYQEPESLLPWLRRLLTETALRDGIGLELQQFACSTWSTDAVGARYEALLRNEVPASWVCTGEETYAFGWGVRRDILQRQLTDFVNRQGPTALCLPADRAARLMQALRT
jgi:hypothetical protein